MSAIADLVARAQISDPRPGVCSSCLQASDPQVRFVNLGATIDRGAVTDPISGAVIQLLDDLHICESCIREAAEVLDYKPGLHARHLQLNRQLMRERDELKDENYKLRQLVGGGA
jgi:hypothetical protein